MKEIASLFTFFLCLCCSAVASNISNQTDKIYVGYTNVTDKNFRERVEIVEFPYNFFVPKQTDEWKECMKYPIFRGLVGDCKIKPFTKHAPLNAKYFMIDLSSMFPIEETWLETVIHELLNQENFSYFTIFQKNSSKIHLEQNEVNADYKKCDIGDQSYKCLYSKTWFLLAYNDRDSLRNGVIYDAGVQDGESFIFHRIYSSDEVINNDVGSGLFVEEKIHQAWEITNEVKNYPISPVIQYTVKSGDFAIRKEVNFAGTFDSCRTSLTDDDNRFSKNDECYCVCVQNEVNKRIEKLKNPWAIAAEIDETSYRECDVLKYMAESVNETFRNVSKLPKNEQQCVREAIQKHINPYGGTPVNMCNIEQILLEIERSRC